MIQKKIWMRYLAFGIFSFFITLINVQCEATVKNRLDIDIIYRNETIHVINYYERLESQQTNRFLFEVQPNSEKKIERRIGSQTSTENCCFGFLNDFQGDNQILIDYNNSEKCLIYPSGEGSTTANYPQSYQRRQISEGYYELIYTFTEEEHNQAEDCN